MEGYIRQRGAGFRSRLTWPYRDVGLSPRLASGVFYAYFQLRGPVGYFSITYISSVIEGRCSISYIES